MKKYDDLGIRMKEYENISRTYLKTKTPIIIRIDGKAFHTFTKGFNKPFDEIFTKAMQETMKYLCENIQGCVLGYTQSDEISLVLVDYKNIDTSAWFDYNIQKCASVAASMATLAFNKFFYENIDDFANTNDSLIAAANKEDRENNEYIRYISILKNALQKGALFDARVFNIPKDEVTNCILWRQNDAIRNSILSLGFANFSHKEMFGKSCNDIRDMLITQKNIDWDNLPTHLKRGSCCIKEYYSVADLNTYSGDIKSVTRSRWIIDDEIPIFKDEGREYIESLINF